MRTTFNEKLCVSSWDKTKNKEYRKHKNRKIRKFMTKNKHWFSDWFSVKIQKIAQQKNASKDATFNQVAKHTLASKKTMQNWIYEARAPSLNHAFDMVSFLAKQSKKTENDILIELYQQWKKR